jgi:peroxiredoxin
MTARSRQRSLFALAALALAAATAAGCREAPPAAPGSASDETAAPILQRLDPPAGPGALAPRLLVFEDAWWLSWLEPAGKTPAEAPGGTGGGSPVMAVRASRLAPDSPDAGWSEPVTVARGDDLFANWADNPALHGGDGVLLAHWLQRSGSGRYAYDVRLARSGDGGRTWQPAGTAHHDGTASEHGFVSSVAVPGGVRLFWLDGREMSTGDGHDAGGHGGGDMTLRTGLAPAGDGPVDDGEVLDGRVCECCQTAAAPAASGPVVVYRDRGPDEERDIWIVRRQAGAWSEPAPVHVDGWRLPGCPVNGPDVASAPADRDRLAVAWFTGADDRPRVQVALSDDGGRRFGEPLVLDDDRPLGRVDVEWDGRGHLLTLWLARGGDDGAARLQLSRLEPGSPPSPPRTLAETAASRTAGFPRMARLGDRLLVAWTTVDETGETGLATGILELAGPASGSETAAAPADPAGPAPGRPWDARPGSRAPEFTATSLEGEETALASFRGRPLLVNIWATWCGPCRREMPALAALHASRASRGLQVVGISVDAARLDGRVREFVAEMQVPYPILRDPEDRATGLFGLTALPATFLFDRDGTLVWRRMGIVQEDDPELASALEPLLSPAAGS